MTRSSKGGPLAFAAHIPFVEELGIELWAAAQGRSELRLPLDGGHLNSLDMAHGGAVMTLLDVAMAQAARTLYREGQPLGPGVTTIEMKTTFVRPAIGELVAKGQVLHRTQTMAFCEGSLFDAGGHLCAHSTGTFKYVRRRPAGPAGPGTEPDPMRRIGD